MRRNETPMRYTLGQAAKATGLSKMTIQRALKTGRISCPPAFGPTRGDETVAAHDRMGGCRQRGRFFPWCPEPAYQLDLGSLSTRDCRHRVACDPEHAFQSSFDGDPAPAAQQRRE